MQGLLKIGFTTREPDDRVRELSAHTGVPGKFSLVKAWEVDNPAYVEQVVFTSLRNCRAEGEFFAISEEEAQDRVIKTLQQLGQADNSGITIPQKLRENLRLQKEKNIQAQQQRIKKCEESWLANLQAIRTKAAAFANQEIGHTYTQLQDEIKKCELPDSVTTPAFFLSLGLSLILESKLEEKRGRQKWVDLQYKWIRVFEDEMEKQKDLWWNTYGGNKPLPGTTGSWSFYQDTKW